MKITYHFLSKSDFIIPGRRMAFRLGSLFSLDNISQVENWAPAKATLGGFIDASDKMEEKNRKEKRDIISRSC